MELLAKPDLLAPGNDTNEATGFAAGLSASALSGGLPRGRLFQILQIRPGAVIRVPANFFDLRP